MILTILMLIVSIGFGYLWTQSPPVVQGILYGSLLFATLILALDKENRNS